MASEALIRMVQAVRDNDAGDWLTGGDPIEGIAQEWLDFGFDDEDVVPWWKAGCFMPYETSELRAQGFTPEQVGLKPEGETETIGYLYCAGEWLMSRVMATI